jgi:hypothetical protein
MAGRRVKGWLREAFPYPIQNPRQCRTSSGRFCDPDSLLIDSSHVQKLEIALQVNRTYALSCKGHHTMEIYSAVSFSAALLRKVRALLIMPLLL